MSFPGPERWQERRDRRLQRREEVGQIGQRLDPQQPLGLDEPQQDDEAHREHEAHEHEDVARTPGRKHVDEQQRDGRCRAPTGMTSERHDGEDRHRQNVSGAQRARPMPASTGDQEHRPPSSGLDHRPREAGHEEAPRRDRRHHQQPQVVRQEEGRERRDHAAEGEERQEGQEQPGQARGAAGSRRARRTAPLPREPERAADQRRAPRRGRCRRRPAARRKSPRSRRRARLRDDQSDGSSRYGNGRACSAAPPASQSASARALPAPGPEPRAPPSDITRPRRSPASRCRR